jgi:hypothetical protein
MNVKRYFIIKAIHKPNQHRGQAGFNNNGKAIISRVYKENTFGDLRGYF